MRFSSRTMRAAKALLRQAARARLEGISPAERAGASALICERLRSLPEWASSRTIGLYAAQPAEPDLQALLHTRGKLFCYPCVRGPELEFHPVDPLTILAPAKWGVLEPPPSTPVDACEIDLLIVPGLAFDSNGGRLGRGGGFYDRFLARPGLAGRAIGVCFQAQIVPEIPREAHDIPVLRVITEQGVFGNDRV